MPLKYFSTVTRRLMRSTGFSIDKPACIKTICSSRASDHSDRAGSPFLEVHFFAFFEIITNTRNGFFFDQLGCRKILIMEFLLTDLSPPPKYCWKWLGNELALKEMFV